MSEPSARAQVVETVAPAILHWTLEDDRIHNRSDSYAIETPDGNVLIDPLPLKESALGDLGEIRAICLTGRFHQRAAWRYQEHFSVPVYAPKNGKGYEGEPDHLYESGDMLPGNLKVVHAPGPTDAHYNFYYTSDNLKAMFIADLLIRRSADNIFRFVPGQFMDNPDLTRESARNLLNYDIDLLCPNHGAVQKGNVHQVIREALEHDLEKGQ
ncbi:MAG: MBL fold metallo-hydrolase [Candidatus Marinimicrobia bacterium]|nr:MBL fold metallo-hydrolase [Candidatus Neomarinimicrobiota bacterium]MCF7828168.1 MBL fold metallo-hydrolase [Candidatus Neomarinimicrobiota bacterium]MCF7879657.1 MBL fold metallo-hydrolase [Candidatus Neomarinimicrobiota bacterium]